MTNTNALVVAAARQLNAELTVQLNAVQLALDSLTDDSPLWANLLEARASMQRVAFLASGMLNWGARRGVVRINATAHRLMDADILDRAA